MGKHEFQQIYRDAMLSLGERPTIKLSSFCDVYFPNANYAGIIIYHTHGKHRWIQSPGQGIAAGYRGRSFYVLILCTDKWPEDALRAAGNGVVHDYLYRQYFNMDYSKKMTCCGGFAVRRADIAFSSVYLNCQSGNVGGLQWQSDGSKYLSQPEQSLVRLAIAEWQGKRPGAVVRIPDSLHAELMSASVLRVACPTPAPYRHYSTYSDDDHDGVILHCCIDNDEYYIDSDE